MNRLLDLFGSLNGEFSVLLVDSAIKGAVLLLIAAGIVLMMRRESAAMRHLVWLVSIVCVLVVPLMSLTLPQWQALPRWVSFSQSQGADGMKGETELVNSLAGHALSNSQTGFDEAGDVKSPTAFELHAGDVSLDRDTSSTNMAPGVAATKTSGQPPRMSWNAIALAVWLTGFCVLMVRIAAARAVLWRMEQTAIAIPDSEAARTKAVFASACKALNIRRTVTLLMHADKSIPVVWGVFRPKLMLPVATQDWSDEQLRSVLLHELAHIQRSDPLGQLLAQCACALHWFNPLAWFANWRLHIERERACDDLVLGSGVRASTYAGHLLNVATTLTTSQWTQVCGLAMARSSSLHGRLSAVLSEKQNRQSVTTAFLATSLLLSVGVAIPLAMLRAAEEPVDPNAADVVSSKEDDNDDAKTVAEDVNVKIPDSAPNTVSNLPPNFETLLDWGDPVNGLRGAVMIQASVQKPELADQPKFILVLQNVSEKPIRFCDTQMIKNDDVQVREDKRTLYLRDKDQGILSGFPSGGGTNTDVVLKPREVVMIDLFYGQEPIEKGPTINAVMLDTIIHDPSLSYSVSLNLVTAPADSWSGKLTTPATRGAYSATGVLPKNEESQKLFRYCLDHARLHGDIPGGILDRLHDKVRNFIAMNTGDQSGDPYAKKMQPIVARFEKPGDWSQADASKLFDDIAAVTTIPLETTLEAIREHKLMRGMPLPASLQNSNWGKVLPSGLRMAWILEPAKDQYHLGTSLKSRVVIHNSGNEPVAFVTRNFHQPAHSATNAAGKAIKLESTTWTTRGRTESYRLHPGECCELYAPGIGVGFNNNDDWANMRPGTWILASKGEEVAFQSGQVWLNGDQSENVDPDWWLKFVKERLGREAPLPASQEERKLILFRVVKDLFGSSPRTDEAESFYADNSPEALDNLALLLSKRTWMNPVTGSIKSETTKFKVLPVDPSAATRPRVVSNAGRYNFGKELRLVVTRKRIGDRVVNEADLTWYPQGKDAVLNPISLPDGYDSWAAGWLPDTAVLWVATRESLCRYDCADPASIQAMTFEGEQQRAAPIPNQLRIDLNRVITGSENPRPAITPPASKN